MLVFLIIVFTFLVGFIGIYYFLSKPQQIPTLKETPQVPSTKKSDKPQKMPEEIKKPAEIPPPKTKTITRAPLLSRLIGFSTDIVDLAIHYDFQHNLILALAEVCFFRNNKNRQENFSYINLLILLGNLKRDS